MTWKCKRQMDHANVLYTRYCDVVIDVVVECKRVPKINAFVRWVGCWLNVLRLEVCGCIVREIKSDPILTLLGSTW